MMGPSDGKHLAPHRRRVGRRTVAGVVVTLIAGVLAVVAPSASAASDEPIDVVDFQFGDSEATIDAMQLICLATQNPCDHPVSTTPLAPNLTFPSTFLDRIDDDVPYGNTPFDCPRASCAVETARAVWMLAIDPDNNDGGDLREGEFIEFTGPAGTVFSDDPLDYVMQDTADDGMDDVFRYSGDGPRFGDQNGPQPAHHATAVQRLSPNRIRIQVAGSDVTGSEDLYIWMANVVNPPAGEYPAVDFRVLTPDQSAFPGRPDSDQEFAFDDAIPENSALTADRSSLTVDETVTMRAVARDAYGNGVANERVVIAPSGSATAAGSVPARTGPDGTMIARFGDRKVEVVEFSALDHDQQFVFLDQPQVRFLHGAPNPSYSSATLVATSVPADTAAEVVVRLADQYANPNQADELILVIQPPTSGPTNVFTKGSIEPKSGSVCANPRHPVPGVTCANTVITSTIQDPAGNPVRQAEARFLVRNPMAESVTFQVSDLSRASSSLGVPITVTWTSTAPTQTSITADPRTVVADGTTASTVTATLRDAQGNPVPNVTVTLSAPSGSSAQISPASRTTSAAGSASFSVRNAAIEDVVLTATYAGTVNGSPVSGTIGTVDISFVAGPPSAASSTLVASPPSRLADGRAAATVLATIRDSSGRPSAGRPVVLSGSVGTSSAITPVVIPMSASGCATQAAAGTTDCNGQAQWSVTDTVVELVTYRATVPGASITVAQPATVDFTKAPSIGASSITASPTSVPADGTSWATVDVVLRDEDGAPLRGKQICLTQAVAGDVAAAPCPDTPVLSTVLPMDIGSGLCTTPVPAGTTDCQGRARFRVTTTSPGAVTYGIIDLTDLPTAALGPEATVTFTAPPTEASQSRLTTDLTAALVGGGAEGTIVATVELRDGAGTLLPGRAARVSASSTTATVSPIQVPATVSGCPTQAAAGTTDCNGRAWFEVTDSVPETVVLRGHDDTASVTLIQTATVRFLPDEASVSTVVADPTVVFADGGSTPEGIAAVTVTLNPGQPLVGHRVLLLQPAGSGATIQAVAIPTSSSGCPVSAPAGTTDCNGRALFTVVRSTAGAVPFTAFDQSSGVVLDQVAAVTFLPPPPTISTLSPVQGPVAGGTVLTITGSGFATTAGGTNITVGGVAATGVNCPSPNQCTATTPAHAAGPVLVVVTTASGPSTPAVAGAATFTYVAAPAPVVTSISPASGPLGGGTVVTINGANLGDATGVRFGATVVAVRSRNSAGTQLTATAPAGSPSTVDVVVITPAGTSATGAGARFTYMAATTTTTRPCTGWFCWLAPSPTTTTTRPPATTTTRPTTTTTRATTTTTRPTTTTTRATTTTRPTTTTTTGACTGWSCWFR